MKFLLDVLPYKSQGIPPNTSPEHTTAMPFRSSKSCDFAQPFTKMQSHLFNMFTRQGLRALVLDNSKQIVPHSPLVYVYESSGFYLHIFKNNTVVFTLND